MAIQKEFRKNIYGETLSFEEAYFQIIGIEGNKNTVNFTVTIYKDSTKEIPIQNKDYTFIPDVDQNSDNFIKQGYEHLKTLPEFENAIDC